MALSVPTSRLLAPALAAAGAALLLRFPPALYPFYPRCPIHQFTGLLCPGCGATRALAAVLYGNWTEALHQNALILLLLPVALYYLLRAELPDFSGPRPRILWLTIALVSTAFTITRNLP